MAARKPLVGLELAVKQNALAILKEGAEFFEGKLKESVSLTDHSLDALRNLGHPYSRSNPRNIHVPPWLVHTQSGDLLNAVTTNVINQFRIQVGIDDTVAPHVDFVVFGTLSMIGRDVVRETWLENRKEFDEIVGDALSRVIQGA